MIFGMWRDALVPLFAIVLFSVSTAQKLVGQEQAAPVSLVVHAVQVEGGQECAKEAEAAARSALQACLDRLCGLDEALHQAADRVRRVYQEHGYYKAAVDDPVRRVGADGIDVTFSVTPGDVYKLEEIKFTHVTVFPPGQLRNLFALLPGDIFNAVKFAAGLDSMRQLYAAKGYITFAPVPQPQFNDETKAVAWTIDLDEGPVFIMGALVLDGAEPQAGVGKRLLADWQPLIGQVYNPDLLRRFLQEHAALLGVRDPDPNVMCGTLLDNKDHVVTVRLNFRD